jgi:hypothetical protein
MGEVAGHDIVYNTTMVWNEFRAIADLLRAHVGKVADQGLTLNAITRATQVCPLPPPRVLSSIHSKIFALVICPVVKMAAWPLLPLLTLHLLLNWIEMASDLYDLSKFMILVDYPLLPRSLLSSSNCSSSPRKQLNPPSLPLSPTTTGVEVRGPVGPDFDEDWHCLPA